MFEYSGFRYVIHGPTGGWTWTPEWVWIVGMASSEEEAHKNAQEWVDEQIVKNAPTITSTPSQA